MTDKIDHISRQKFMQELRRYQKGSVTRRHFLGVTGLGAASAVLAGAMPAFRPSPAYAEGSIGDKVVLATWPNYHDPANFEAFTKATGAAVQVNVFGSNEEMLAKLQAWKWLELLTNLRRRLSLMVWTRQRIKRSSCSIWAAVRLTYLFSKLR